MATHNLFLGGARVAPTVPYTMFPQVEMPAGSTASIDDRSGSVVYAPTRTFVFKGSENRRFNANAEGSDGLAEYIATHTFANGDIINAVILPQKMMVTGVWWSVDEVVPGVSVDVTIRDAGTVVGTIDLSVVGDGYFHLPAPVYVPRPQDDMLQLTFDGPVTNALLECALFRVAPLVTRFCTKTN